MIYATGYIEEDLAIKLDDVYLVGEKEYLPLEVVLDTGFSDQFCLPLTYKNQCKHDFLGDSIYILANGEEIQDELYRIELVINNKSYSVIASFTNDTECLLGMELLREKIITINTKNNTLLITS